MVRSNLPANASYTWTLVSDVPAAPGLQTNPVMESTVGNNFEISNGLTGVRVVQTNNANTNLAPIQGICYTLCTSPVPGASWTGTGAVLLSQSLAFLGNVSEPLNTPLIPQLAPSYSVTVVDSGPMKTVVKASYTFTRPVYTTGNFIINNANSANGDPVNTPGSGHYTTLVTLYANSKSVLIDEDTDMQFTYSLPVYAQLTPDTARWRGFDAGNPICGYEPPLTVTGATGTTPVVITTLTSGNLTNGQVVAISGVNYYAKTIGYTATTFALYVDPNLTVPVAANAYISGGIVKPAYRGQGLVPDEDAFQD